MRAAVVLALLGLGLIGAALLVDRYEERGVATTAKVSGCETRYKLPALCRGTWVEGDLLDGGRVVFGPIDGAGRGDIGKEIAVRAEGDSAWTISNRLPYILAGSGIATILSGVFVAVRGALRRHGSGTSPPGGIASIGTDP